MKSSLFAIFLASFVKVQNTEFDFFFSDFSLPDVTSNWLWLLKKLFIKVDKQNNLTPEFHCKLCIFLNLYTTKKLAKKIGNLYTNS